MAACDSSGTSASGSAIWRNTALDLAKHGLDFRRAVHVFNDPNLGYPSRRHGEDRQFTIGIAHDQVVAVIWTGRSGLIRVISMRRARRAEARQYRQLFG
jgi:uncharacterized DUF497 family protein